MDTEFALAASFNIQCCKTVKVNISLLQAMEAHRVARG
jgi:hypothetical protein